MKERPDFLTEAVRCRLSDRRGDLPGKYWYPLAQATYGAEEIMAVVDSLCAFRTTMSSTTAEFERRFAEWQGCRHAVMVNSGSSADLLVAFAYAQERPGGEVLVPAVTWPTQVWSWMMAGFKVRLVDVDPDTLNMDVRWLENACADDTVAVSATHLMGNPVHMHSLGAVCRFKGLDLFEDCCEALGATVHGDRVGSFGRAATFSFFFSHHMTTLEGGMIVTDDPELADRLRLLRAHGWTRDLPDRVQTEQGLDPRFTFRSWGFNVRPTEPQAAFGMVQLTKLDEMNKRRRELYDRFAEGLDTWNNGTLTLPHAGSDASPFGIPIMVADGARFTRTSLSQWLEAKGVETRRIVAGNLARHPAGKAYGFDRFHLPGADAVHDRGLAIGLSPMSSFADVDRVVDAFATFLKGAC